MTVRTRRWMSSHDNFQSLYLANAVGVLFFAVHRRSEDDKKWLQFIGSVVLKCVLHASSTGNVKTTVVDSFWQAKPSLVTLSLLFYLYFWSMNCRDHSQWLSLIIIKVAVRSLITVGSASLFWEASKGPEWLQYIKAPLSSWIVFVKPKAGGLLCVQSHHGTLSQNRNKQG